ncbi:MAG TPA: hypothetical protein VH062_03910 [Polyangiaceae bacterium]|jgi:hypothetical protein|nr:hypothetical protein [Polyangiaceae bacterium]
MNPWKVSTLVLTVAFGVVVGGTIVNAAPADDQPKMQSALDHLKAAKASLDSAAHDHGGHRAKAEKATDLAISEVKDGIDYANSHPDPKPGGPSPKGGGGPNPKGNGPQPK